MSQSYKRAEQMWSQDFRPGTDLCAEIAACIDAAVAEERAAVVAYLRLEALEWDETGPGRAACRLTALTIERGEHRRGEAAP